MSPEKYLIKKAMSEIIPKEILYGPKRGFDVPYLFSIFIITH